MNTKGWKVLRICFIFNFCFSKFYNRIISVHLDIISDSNPLLSLEWCMYVCITRFSDQWEVEMQLHVFLTSALDGGKKVAGTNWT